MGRKRRDYPPDDKINFKIDFVRNASPVPKPAPLTEPKQKVIHTHFTRNKRQCVPPSPPKKISTFKQSKICIDEWDKKK